MTTPHRLLAIDWSGNATGAGQRKHIWVADWHEGRVALSAGRTRPETIAHVIDLAQATPALVVGFDFSFSYPAWFLRQNGAESALAHWQIVEEHGERWQQQCLPPFWGRPGRACPTDHRGGQWQGYRLTERATGNLTRRLPSSTFQINGAGAVGIGSLRGMPHLLTLKRAGFSVWPFDNPRLPLAVEIYPRLFTGTVRVSDASARSTYLGEDRFDGLPSEVRANARNSPDAFDALCSVMGMAAHARQFARLQRATNTERLLEGAIWSPGEQ
jgi:hypothetical protein